MMLIKDFGGPSLDHDGRIVGRAKVKVNPYVTYVNTWMEGMVPIYLNLHVSTFYLINLLSLWGDILHVFVL